jgi:ankyrin repeat protein
MSKKSERKVMIISEKEKEEIQRLILEFKKDKSTWVHNAIKNQSELLIQLGVNRGFPLDTYDENGFTPLTLAISNANINLAVYLLRKGADPCIGTRVLGQTPLHMAVSLYTTASVIELINQLIDLGADVNVRNWNGSTPLHIAARTARAHNIKALVMRGADLDLKDNQDHTPLDEALLHFHENTAVFLKELKAKVDPPRIVTPFEDGLCLDDIMSLGYSLGSALYQ